MFEPLPDSGVRPAAFIQAVPKTLGLNQMNPVSRGTKAVNRMTTKLRAMFFVFLVEKRCLLSNLNK